jgi:CRISPR/Cas system Type II protein with McrA/HNH and RuvC-like nuclease domain
MQKAATVKASEIHEKLRQQNFRCAYSGTELTPETASLDHILPVSKGGDHNINNISIVHAKVNIAKGSMTLEEFIQLCREVVTHTDSLAAI